MATIWYPDWPPASADDKDDEFDDSSFDTGKWTEWDPSSTLTISEATYGLSLVQSSTANIAGCYQAVPAGDWAIWTKMSLLAIGATGNPSAGLLLGQDLTNNPNTSDIYGFRLYHSGPAIQLAKWNDYTKAGGSQISAIADAVIGTHLYLRIRKASTTYSFDWSNDGTGWQQMYSSTLAFTPAEFGLMVLNDSMGANHRAVFEFFRCVDGTPALTDVMNGKRIL